MTRDGRRPLVFLDIDGTLVTFGAERQGVFDERDEDARRSLVDSALSRRLAGLAGELVWATAWGDEANTVLAPLLDLPQLPVVGWLETSASADPEDLCFGLHWKTKAIVEWARGRAFAWLDDELTEDDQAWVAANHPEPALLLSVEPSRGVTAADLDELADWIDGLSG